MSAPPRNRVEPLRGLLYNRDKFHDLANMVAPPYDVIGPARQRELYDRSEFNVVRLELNREPDPYEPAAKLLREWIAAGVCIRAQRPAIYLLSQTFEHAGQTARRDGFIARVRVEEFNRGRILPHERTFAAPKEDRMRLLMATRTNLSSVFALYPEGIGELATLRQSIRGRASIVDFTDDLGIRNELRAFEDDAEIATIRRALENVRLLIADGHHRYETALEYARRRRAEDRYAAADARNYDYTMMTLAGCDDPGLRILPTHRIVREIDGEAIAGFKRRAAEIFEVVEFKSGPDLRTSLDRAGAGAIGAALRGIDAPYLLRLKDRAAAEASMDAVPEPVRYLDVSVLHAIILARLLGLSDVTVRKGGNIDYTIDADEALAAVKAGRAAAAFVLNAPSIHDVARVADAGATMPEKSTYFYPKLLTGLVMNPVDD